MAIDRKLRAVLLNKLNVSPQRLSQRVKLVKEHYGPMPTELATYVIAHKEGIDLTKFLNIETVDRVRSLLPNNGAIVVEQIRRKKTRAAPSYARINIVGKLPDVDAFLSSGIAKDAQAMAQVYPIYYTLENSLRIVIKRIMENKYGKQWWDSKAPKPVKKNVDDRKCQEDKKPWHGKRGQHEIFYSNFGDLRTIIERNWDDFKKFFPSRLWITQKLDELENPRNVLAHHNPVSKIDLKRMEVYFEDWVNLLKDRRQLIP